MRRLNKACTTSCANGGLAAFTADFRSLEAQDFFGELNFFADRPEKNDDPLAGFHLGAKPK
jgi:hypothetical protein